MSRTIILNFTGEYLSNEAHSELHELEFKGIIEELLAENVPHDFAHAYELANAVQYAQKNVMKKAMDSAAKWDVDNIIYVLPDGDPMVSYILTVILRKSAELLTNVTFWVIFQIYDPNEDPPRVVTIVM